mgnify:CR=1 FL=1
MSKENLKLTPIQQDYKDFLSKKYHLREHALMRITAIRKEVTALHMEETKLEGLVSDLTDK